MRLEPGYRVVHLPRWGSFILSLPLDERDLVAILATHEDTRDPARVLKMTEDRTVTRVPLRQARDFSSATTGDAQVFREVVVKEVRLPWRWRIPQILGFPSRFRRDPEKARALREVGLLVPPCIAASVRGREGRDFLVTGFLEGAASLKACLWAGPERIADEGGLVAVLEAVGRWLRGVHDRGVWQRDMKPDNLFLRRRPAGAQGVRGGMAPEPTGPAPAAPADAGRARTRLDADAGVEFCLVDTTDVRLLRVGLGVPRRVRNLGQILDLPAALDSVARAPLLRAYTGAGAEDSGRWEALVDADIRARRAHRRSVCGFDHVDEEARVEDTDPSASSADSDPGRP